MIISTTTTRLQLEYYDTVAPSPAKRKRHASSSIAASPDSRESITKRQTVQSPSKSKPLTASQEFHSQSEASDSESDDVDTRLASQPESEEEDSGEEEEEEDFTRANEYLDQDLDDELDLDRLEEEESDESDIRYRSFVQLQIGGFCENRLRRPIQNKVLVIVFKSD